MKRARMSQARREIRKPKTKGKKNGKGTPVSATTSAKQDPLHGLSKDKRKEVRAEMAFQKQHLSLYANREDILLVGEGNFSFARALCERLDSGEGVIATAFDNDATLKKKYPDSMALREEVESTGGTCLVGVDATRLHQVKEFQGTFSKIVWNFPHLGMGEKDVEKSIAQHQELLGNFFASAAKCLNASKRDSAIHVALRVGEPYKSWKIVQVAHAACPDIEFSVRFSYSAWPGYEHRRTVGTSDAKRDMEADHKEAK
eukprot:CAMPEP_0178392690 /NCGR_PEP_ID=MMETSP0689_2-20121128/11806_1 /TAXON_ID=160604 /ORGANISM="Amphidinium massartii, Strain CS-259" /LENGTH=257 /DNA_ID=CAMNT_0020013267 /DNA_START=1 /DNA_END=772 /DNA_ORIENTATION=+